MSYTIKSMSFNKFRVACQGQPGRKTRLESDLQAHEYARLGINAANSQPLKPVASNSITYAQLLQSGASMGSGKNCNMPKNYRHKHKNTHTLKHTHSHLPEHATGQWDRLRRSRLEKPGLEFRLNPKHRRWNLRLQTGQCCLWYVTYQLEGFLLKKTDAVQAMQSAYSSVESCHDVILWDTIAKIYRYHWYYSLLIHINTILMY